MAQQIGIINVGNAGYGNMQLSVEYDLIRQDVNSNISTVRLYEYLHVPSGYISWSRGTAMLHGTTFNLSTSYNAGKNLLKTMDINVGHDTNGNGSFYIGYSISTSYIANGSGTTSTVTLPNIPRYSTITNIVSTDKTCLTVSLSATADRTVNKTEYQIKEQGGAYGAFTTVKTGNHTSASWAIDKLKPNTTYIVNVHVTNAQSGLVSGKEYTVKTYALSVAKSDVVNYDVSKRITVTREVDTMLHTVYILLGGVKLGELSNVATSMSITATSELQDALLKHSPNSNTNTFTISCETYLNGVYQGITETLSDYIIVASNILIPTLDNVTNQDINDNTILITGDATQLIESHSTVEVTIGELTSMKYANLSRVDVLCLGNIYSKSFSNTNDEKNVKISFTAPVSDVNQKVTVVVYDTRGMIAQTTTILKMINYQEPSFVSYSADREFNYNPSTILNALLNYSKITVNGEDRNTFFAKYRIKETTSTNYGSWIDIQIKNISDQNINTNRVTIEQFMGNYDTDKSYDVQLWIGDIFDLIQSNNLIATFQLNKGIALLRLEENGTHFEDDVYMDSQSTIYLNEPVLGYEKATTQEGGVLSFRGTPTGVSIEPIINSIGQNQNVTSFARLDEFFGFFGFVGNGVDAALSTFVTFNENGMSVNGVTQPYVIDSVIGSNYNRIKWSDGRMEQWGSINVTYTGGSTYQDVLTGEVTYIEIPNAQVTVQPITWGCIATISKLTANGIGGIAVYTINAPNDSHTAPVYWRTIGRWK